MTRNDQINIAKIIRQTISAEPEKRGHFRLSLHLPMEYSFPESSRHRLAYMVDLCEDGLLMHTPEELEVGQKLTVKFYYDSAPGIDSVQASGEIIRVERLGKSEKEYRCAVRFFALPADILKKLRNFLKTPY